MDIKQSFHLTLNEYRSYTSEQLFFPAEKQKEYASLNKLIEAITKKLSATTKNTINPFTFIHGHDGYILPKEANRTNIMYHVKKEKTNGLS
ncbi:hypothetical protein [Priestia taiwanensis]|uniref:Uncharacterized protein n=1 Tax=Priestia taiwanensis TaxID=1347902 RepID=A0A917AKS7_9BACI|nr:hypothetical protein [Priestia taiwanensis]GGE58797.1 hypothetical protein GCM10007140_06440 [Priestia taiwanensis]